VERPLSERAAHEARLAAIEANLAAIEERVAAACRRAGRARTEVMLVGVSKGMDADVVRAAAGAGLTTFGENYVQEWLAKRDALPDLASAIAWHFVGRIQRNKAAAIAEATLVHSLADVRAAGALAAVGARRGAPVRALVQVNVDDEATKGGVAPDALPAVLEELRALDGLAIDGLMVIPPPLPPDAVRGSFRRLRELRDRQSDAASLRALSMGMSGDFEVAIEEGATLIRVGTAIFGPRTRKE
jgi:pyridoxal phosphate enzyme (YggS family)